MMNFNLKPRVIRQKQPSGGKSSARPKFSLGDTVVLQQLTAPSLNLYEKLKSSGYSYIKCPCNIKSTITCVIEKQYGNQGFILRTSLGFLSVAHQNDLRRV